jgi:hypothetical protein
MKRIAILLLGIMLFQASAGGACIHGDVNEDGKITPHDLFSLNDMLGGEDSLPEEGSAEYACADVNGDGLLNGSDIILLKKLLDDKKNGTLEPQPQEVKAPAGEVSKEAISEKQKENPLELSGAYTNPEMINQGQEFDFYLEVNNRAEVPFNDTIRLVFWKGEERIAVREREVVIPPAKEKKIVFKGLQYDFQVGKSEITVSLKYGVGGELFSDSLEASIRVAPAAEEEDGSGGKGTVYLYIIAVVAIILLLVGLGYLYNRKKRGKYVPSGSSVGDELKDLYKQKEELEEMIKIAKIKYYKRKLDESSYKEIVTTNQQKLIGIEARIEKMEKRINALEEKQDKNKKS